MKTGKISENILKRSVLGKIKTHRREIQKGAGVGEDCAFLAWGDGLCPSAVSTQTFTLPVKRGTYYAIMAAANNLAASGAVPAAVTLSLTLPQEAEEAVLKELMEQAEECCRELDIQIAGGHTEVSGAVNWPVVTATAIGRPVKREGRYEEHKENKEHKERGGHKGCAGRKDVVVSKWIGMEGTAILVREKEEELLKRFSPGFLGAAREQERYLSVEREAAIALKSSVYAMHDVRNGGIFGALWELSQKLGVGLSIDLKKIPVKQETIEICEFFNISPYELLSGGSLIMAAADGYGLVRELKRAGIAASVIGSTNDSNDRLILNGEETRYLGPPGPDEIHKIAFQEERIG